MYLVLFGLYLVVSLPRVRAAYTQEESNTIGQVRFSGGCKSRRWLLVWVILRAAYTHTPTREGVR